MEQTKTCQHEQKRSNRINTLYFFIEVVFDRKLNEERGVIKAVFTNSAKAKAYRGNFNKNKSGYGYILTKNTKTDILPINAVLTDGEELEELIK